MPTPVITKETPRNPMRLIRYIYLYLVTAITIVLILISTIGCLNIVIRDYVFNVQDYEKLNGPFECQDDQLFYTNDKNGQRVEKSPRLTEQEKTVKRDECTKQANIKIDIRHSNDVKRELAQYLSMFLIALPLYLYHWGIIKKENNKD